MPDDFQIILGNSNKRFSGVTSTMLQVLEKQKQLTKVAVLGKYHVEPDIQTLTFWQMIKICQRPLPNGQYRVFHARRNDEMIQALIAKWLGAKIKIAFTSTAQRYHSAFTRWLMRQMDGIISTCSAAAGFLRTPPDIIIPHGVDISAYSPPTSKQSAWQALGYPGDFGIGVFGRVRHSKGIDVLVDACLELLPRHPAATVVVCGECLPADQSFKQGLIDKLTAAGLLSRVLFIGKQPFQKIPELYQGMSIVTALSREEGFGLTPLEAMASGCAVVTSSAGAWPDIIQNDEVGYLTKTGNVKEVIEKLEFLMNTPSIAEGMGQRGRSCVEEHYSSEREAIRLTEYLLKLACR